MRAASRRAPADPARELYQTPLAEFVRARNEIAARLSRSGHADEAKAVRALAKPKATVWGLNRVAHRTPKTIQRALKTFDALKDAQLRRPEQFGHASEELRVAVDAAVDQAAALMTAEGLRVSLDMRRRMDTTLRGAAAGARDALVRGGLTEELPAPGFELFTAAKPRARRTRST